MITYDAFTLDNGLEVFVHQDFRAPVATMNLIYNVGSRNEHPDKTGFAHLFEHLMFGGSANISSYDEPLQRAGGENNAFTSKDITNYYINLPASNLETAFWLESDRMLSLSFDPKVLEVQRSVVIEEFKQRYLNQPYGDVWLHLSPLVYQVHPYNWPTIGKKIEHIEEATMDDVRRFFYAHYLPNNAKLVVAGAVQTDEVKRLAEKWFGPIPAGKVESNSWSLEPEQVSARRQTIEADVPMDAIYRAYPMARKGAKGYFEADLLADVLGRGKSSRAYEKLVNDTKLFNNIQAYTTQTFDEGLLVIDGKLNKGVSAAAAEAALDEVIYSLSENGPDEGETEKVRNQAETVLEFGLAPVLSRALGIAMGAVQGDPERINKDAIEIRGVSQEGLSHEAKKVLRPEKANTLVYLAKK